MMMTMKSVFWWRKPEYDDGGDDVDDEDDDEDEDEDEDVV